MINTLYGWMGTPVTPTSWNADLIIEREKTFSFTKDLGSLAIIIGGFGLLVTCSKGLISRKISIISVVMSTVTFVLGIVLRRIANAHFKGLSAEDRDAFALAELKKGFEELPVCKSKDDLEERVANDPDFSSLIAMHAVNRSNTIRHLAFPKYFPTKDLQPIFDITNGLSARQNLELLETAYLNKIILEFPWLYRIYTSMASSPPKHLGNIKGRDKEKMDNAFNLSLAFLKNSFDKALPFDQEMLNKQLEALSVHWPAAGGQQHVSYPSFYVEDQNTVVIRNHLLSSKDLLSAIKELSPFVNSIKIEEMRRPLYEDDYANHGGGGWSVEKQDLQANGKCLFVDRTNEQVKIWQTIDYKEDCLREMFNHTLEDIKNGKNDKSLGRGLFAYTSTIFMDGRMRCD